MPYAHVVAARVPIGEPATVVANLICDDRAEMLACVLSIKGILTILHFALVRAQKQKLHECKSHTYINICISIYIYIYIYICMYVCCFVF